jgi:glycosyltransferase involved in cell wall biosynthesis
MTTTEPKRAVFAGCVKNCAHHLPAVLRNIDRLRWLFEDAAFVFVENDSTDATKAILNRWGNGKANYFPINLDGLDAIRQRTVRLEIARNIYLDFVRGNPSLSSHDYLVVLDFDEVSSGNFDSGVVRDALAFLEQEESRAAVFANNVGVYNDLWALRHKDLCPGDAWEEVFDYNFRHQSTDAIAFQETFEKRLLSIDRKRDPIEVESAFNGFGIYKLAFVRRNQCPYLGSKVKVMQKEGQLGIVRWQTCEHVHFNAGLRHEGGRLFILPSLILFEGKREKFPTSVWRTLTF